LSRKPPEETDKMLFIIESAHEKCKVNKQWCAFGDAAKESDGLADCGLVI